MAASQRIDDLRRRVQKDPASIAFAQLAEECRRAGQVEEAVEVCRAGLAIHPGYLSARVTLGRALIELNDLDQALQELTLVLKSAPENLAAIRGTAEIHHRRGDLGEALAQYRAALALARNDPDLQQTVAELARQVEPPPPPPAADEGLSFEQLTNEFLKMAPPEAAPPEPTPAPPELVSGPPTPEQAATALDTTAEPPPHVFEPLTSPADAVAAAAPTIEEIPETIAETPETIAEIPETNDVAGIDAPLEEMALADPGPSMSASFDDSAAREHAARTIAALEQWLDAIHVARAHRSA